MRKLLGQGLKRLQRQAKGVLHKSLASDPREDDDDDDEPQPGQGRGSVSCSPWAPLAVASLMTAAGPPPLASVHSRHSMHT